MKLDQGHIPARKRLPTRKQLLPARKQALDVPLKGLPSHCCLFRGPKNPPLEQLFVAPEISKLLDKF